MIKEAYCSFETAKLLKEKGFPQHITSHTYFIGDDKKRGCIVGEFIGHPSVETDIHLIDAPTQQMTLAWLRENYSFHICIYMNGVNSWKYEIEDLTELSNETSKDKILFYEEAVEDAIKYCLENLI